MARDNISTQKTIGSINNYIINLDSFRLPLSIFAPRLLAFFKFFSNFSKLGKKSDLFLKNPDLHRKLQKELDPYFKEVMKITIKDIALYFGGYILIKILLFIIDNLLRNVFLFENTVLNFTIIIFQIIWLIYLLFWIFTKHMRLASEKYDFKIKKAVQELIDFGIDLSMEKKLNSSDFPIPLRNDDYERLNYEMTGKIKYIGFFEK